MSLSLEQSPTTGNDGIRAFSRHPELVSGSIHPVARDFPVRSALAARWMLNQVQHDEAGFGELPA
ncbi:hypothetical protein [Novosphingobium sp. Chol11]|uniref:hypothetical protein n=1 Tax=Novosphingobium sp. Chol11 TaxID=1385763 RepID=UPI0025D9793E|nr:hypothetical protein [Novosphingobium sp. Chol11]